MYLRALLGWHNIYNLTTCNISEELWDVHDYPVSKGGDGFPLHMVHYTCPACRKRFMI